MGVVYLGQSPKGTLVAVKLVRSEFADDSAFRARFKREVQAASRVDGAFTASVLDSDVDSDRPFLVTEYVEGPTLGEQIEAAGPLPHNEARAVGAALAEALEAIHGAGLVHRDLKPSNILLGREGPRVIDFGIARAIDATSITHTGLTLGTPAWMAPEQIRGKDVGPAADIFAWGTLVAFACTGRVPFGEGPTDAVLYRVLNEEPDLDGLANDLRPIVEAAIQKNPAARPQAGQLLRLLLGDQGRVGPVDDARTLTVASVKDTWHVTLERRSPARTKDRRLAARFALGVSIAAAVFVGALVVGNLKPAVGEGGPGSAKDANASASSTTIQEAFPPPSARDVPISSLMRAGAQRKRILYGELDGDVPEEIVVVATKDMGGLLPAHFVDVFAWRDEEWRRVFSGTSFHPESAERTILSSPEEARDQYGGQDLVFSRVVDLGGRNDYLVLGTMPIGASGGPIEVWVVSPKASENGFELDFQFATERAGDLTVSDRGLVLEAPLYTRDDPMCCPSGREEVLIRERGGRVQTTSNRLVATSPQGLANIMYSSWMTNDRATAERVAEPQAVDFLFDVQWDRSFEQPGCPEEFSRPAYCYVRYPGGSITFFYKGDAANGYRVQSITSSPD